MALTITITDPKLIELIQQKAEEAGVSLSEAAHLVLEEGASETMRTQVHTPLTAEYKAERKAKVMATLAEIHAVIRRQDRFGDYDAWLYDWAGLPQ